MSGAADVLREEIARSGPIPFHRFMEVALYHEDHGYYRRGKDPFGKSGDFYTAEQIQPMFGILINSYIQALAAELGRPADFTVVELGAGRAEMAEHFRDCLYVPVEVGGEMPSGFSGVVLANEFFDALPVHVARKRKDGYHRMLVDCREGAFYWREEGLVATDVAAYLDAHTIDVPEGSLVEANLDALDWLDQITSKLEQGWLLVIDYGYSSRELVRFPSGTLMSYSKHLALEDVLTDPGSRDITAHVCFTALERRAAQLGLRKERFESLARLLLRVGEEDRFEHALAGVTAPERTQRMLQLKHLVFGLGETFHCLLLRKPKGGH